MQYTENHSLPQWEANDPIQRGDFNAAMATIDAALGAGGVSHHRFILSDKAVGDTVCTFEKAPKFVIVFGSWCSCFIQSGSIVQLMDYYTYNNERSVVFQLSGTSLILTSIGSGASTLCPGVAAFY